MKLNFLASVLLAVNLFFPISSIAEKTKDEFIQYYQSCGLSQLIEYHEKLKSIKVSSNTLEAASTQTAFESVSSTQQFDATALKKNMSILEKISAEDKELNTKCMSLAGALVEANITAGEKFSQSGNTSCAKNSAQATQVYREINTGCADASLGATGTQVSTGGAGKTADFLMPVLLGAGIGALAAGMLKKDDNKDDKKPASEKKSESAAPVASEASEEVPQEETIEDSSDEDGGSGDSDDDENTEDDNGGEDNAESPLPPPDDLEYGEDGSGSGGDDSEGTTIASQYDQTACISQNIENRDPACDAESLSAYSRRGASQSSSSANVNENASTDLEDVEVFEGGRDGT